MANPANAHPAVDLDLARPGQPLSLSGYSPQSKPWDPEKDRAEGAKWVARTIVGTFAGTIALVLIAIAVIVAAAGSPDDAKRFTDTLVAILESLGKFLTAVFGPLLAFILGYYFSEKQKGGQNQRDN
jgi:type IV secretory pathway VirB2 component (pilin)